MTAVNSGSEIVVSDAVIAGVAAHAAAAVPGVTRLEPGLRGLLSGWSRAGKQLLGAAESAGSQGVRVGRTGAGRIAVQVDVSLSGDCRAAVVGAAVQRAVLDAVLEQTGVTVGEVSVTVLDIEPGAL